MAPKARNARNKGYPKGWRWKNGAWRYRVPAGLESMWDGKKEFTLGKTDAEAYKTWGDRIETQGTARTIGELLDEYARREIPRKRPRTQKSYHDAIKNLRKVFANVPIQAIRPAHAYKYVYVRSKDGHTAAVREFEVLRAAYSAAVKWGLLDRNPLIGTVRLEKPRGRTRYVEDYEILAALSITPRRKRGSVRMMQAYIRIKLLTGLRRTDLLRLKTTDLTGAGIRVTPSKTAMTTGAARLYEWTPRLREAVQEALDARPVDISPYVFCNRYGGSYDAEGSANGFESIWGRFMARVVAETGTRRFSERDLRAKAGTDADSIEHAQSLLAHADSRTTKKWYRRKPEKVKPGGKW